MCACCERTLRRQLSSAPDSVHAGDFSGVRQFFSPEALQRVYSTEFDRGPRGGALIPFGNAITLECFLPFEEPDGISLPFMPMTLTGSIVHDVGKKKAAKPYEVEACETGRCDCSDRPTGWIITRPIARALLSVTDSWLNDHGRSLAGLLNHSWALTYSTPEFMAETYFGGMLIPTRAESRAARRAREAARAAAGWRHIHPEHRTRRMKGSSNNKP